MSTLPLWQAYQVAAATRGTLLGPSDWSIRGLSIDTRTLVPGDLFVALAAERDGHDFVSQAFEKGASAALVSREVPGAGPQVLVPDTLQGAADLAAASRDRSFAPLIGVTGSAGKTTTKEMLRVALKPLGEVHAAEKSFNNHIGVPLTLAALPVTAKAGVFEMGMNHAGEIRALTALVRPHIAIITTIAEAHIENLGSLEAIADAKSEIAEGVRPGGVMILPADSPYYDRLEAAARRAGSDDIRSFGRKGKDAKLLHLTESSSGTMINAEVLGAPLSFVLHAPGEHMATNALAALLAAVEAGVAPVDAAAALSDFQSGDGRGATHRLLLGDRAITVLDESYNANPASMRASLSVLAKREGRRIAVLGEMRELGDGSRGFHAELAGPAQAAADRVYTAGPMMAALFEALSPDHRGEHRETAGALLQVLLEHLQDGDTVLFKGSNASKVGDLVEAILKAGQRL